MILLNNATDLLFFYEVTDRQSYRANTRGPSGPKNIYLWPQDIVQGTFLDTYKNLTYKSVMGQHWVSTYCQVKVFKVQAYKAKVG